jgi:PhzF family phenazine biosynthesis protein
MRTPIFQVGAFTRRRFGGNPAALMSMESLLADATLPAIAAENNLSETAFLVPSDGDYRLGWSTPTTEVPSCARLLSPAPPVVTDRLELAGIV